MMAPKAATPNAPPIWRKNCAAAVATPRSRWSTEFWTTRIVTCIVAPTPRPSTTMNSELHTRGVSARMKVSRIMPTDASARPPIGQPR